MKKPSSQRQSTFYAPCAPRPEQSVVPAHASCRRRTPTEKPLLALKITYLVEKIIVSFTVICIFSIVRQLRWKKKAKLFALTK